MCQCTLYPHHLTVKTRGICAFLKSTESNTAEAILALSSGQEDPVVMKSTKEALARGLKFKQAVKDLKNASSSSKWRPPSIPLTTPVGIADMTLDDMMKKEKLS